MYKELEEAKEWLKKNIAYYEEQLKIISVLDDSDYYDEETELYKNRTRIFETVLNYIENSIPKKKVEEKLIIDSDKLNHSTNGILSEMYKARITLAKELLEVE